MRKSIAEIWDRYGTRSMEVFEISDDTGAYLEFRIPDEYLSLDNAALQELFTILSRWVE